MSYTVRKSIFGRHNVHFACNSCAQAIIAPLEDAGNVEPCPSCGQPQRTPGERERQLQQESADREAEANQIRAEALRARSTARRTSDRGKSRSGMMRSSMVSQTLLQQDQIDIRNVDWADRRMWRAFKFLRRIFAAQLMAGIVFMWIGGIALALGLVFAIYRLVESKGDASVFGLAILAAIGNAAVFAIVGYVLYVTAALSATIVHIERNTRATLDPARVAPPSAPRAPETSSDLIHNPAP